MRERSEGAFATMIIVSVAMIVGGVFALMIGVGGGSLQMIRAQGVSGMAAWTAILGAIGFFGGIALLLFTMVSGAAIGKTENRGVRKVDQRAKVLARYVVDKAGETVVLESDFVDAGFRYYARLLLSDGTRAEFQCVREVFFQCGEGMTGEAHFQGRWLGNFRPYIGIQPMH